MQECCHSDRFTCPVSACSRARTLSGGGGGVPTVGGNEIGARGTAGRGIARGGSEMPQRLRCRLHAGACARTDRRRVKWPYFRSRFRVGVTARRPIVLASSERRGDVRGRTISGGVRGRRGEPGSLREYARRRCLSRTNGTASRRTGFAEGGPADLREPWTAEQVEDERERRQDGDAERTPGANPVLLDAPEHAPGANSREMERAQGYPPR